MDSEKFIEEIKKFPELYDKNNRCYLDHKKKDRIWKDISEKFGIDAKSKWTYLRDKFNKEKKKFDQPSGSPALNKKPWALYPFLTFLGDYVKPRRLLENSSPEELEEFLIEDEWSSSSHFDSDSTSTPLNAPPPPPPKTKRRNPQIDEMFMDTLSKIGKKYESAGEEDPADQLFLDSIKCEMKKMSSTAKLTFKITMLEQVKKALEDDK